MRRILVSLGNIGAFHDGLGEFALQIGQRIAAAAPGWRDRHGVAFDFHLRDKLFGVFGDAVGYRAVTRWQRLRHLQTERYALWHSLHQLNKCRPPEGTPRRLVTVHDLNYLYGRNAFSTWRHDRRTRGLLARADHLVAISRHTANDVQRHFGWRGPLDVIYNGARSFVGQPQQALPGWEGVDTGRQPFLFHLSRMSASKNPGVLVELARLWPEMRFVFCGPPSDDAKALRAANRLPNVQFHLGITDAHKAWAYARCAGFLFPSLTEGFGLPPIEAMHFGKPVFLARRTSLPEVGGAVAHYFDDAFEPRAMRRLIEAALAADAADPSRAEAVHAHAARFDWDRCASDYLALYARLLGSGAAA
ncbi:MAG: glycosyltransferase family 4 protein [Rubrivivax sp.]|jgi:glycosyltransferase involved in cell wall biosynthesis|nr:glycosyltransferase family 4 protein [Rubrivivax sp.]